MDNGKEICDVDMEFKFGQMEQNIKVNGKMEKLMVEVNLLMLTEMFIKVIGKTIKLADMEFINIITVPNIKDNGSTITNMVRG
jgi:phosphosulfolactate synthase (CoM biosynthesis protein A)